MAYNTEVIKDHLSDWTLPDTAPPPATIISPEAARKVPYFTRARLTFGVTDYRIGRNTEEGLTSKSAILDFFQNTPGLIIRAPFDKYAAYNPLMSKDLWGKKHNYNGTVWRAAYHNPESFFMTLDTITDPAQYVWFFMLAPAFGIVTDDPSGTMTPWEMQPVKYPPNQMVTSKYSRKELSELLGVYAQRFQEVISSRMLTASFDVLDASRIWDLPSAAAKLSVIINRVREDVPRFIESYQTIELIDPRSGALVAKKRVHLSPRQKQRFYSIFNVEVELLKQNTKKLVAQVEKLADPRKSLTETEFHRDESRNPFLFFDPEATGPEGQAVFRDVSAQEAQRSPIVSYSGRFTKKEMEAAPIVEEYYKRETFGPGSRSPADTAGGTGGLLPWLIAGGAAAYGLSQVL